MPAANSPTVRQRRLRAEMRRSRAEAGLTQEQVAENLDWSLSKVIRIESGSVNISTTDLKALLALYRVADDRVAELVELARSARERAWWSGYRKILSPQYYELIGYESAASIVRQYENLILPGLLQTQEYAQEYIGGDLPPEQAGDVEPLVEVRMRRQEILERENPPLLLFILDEATVRRQIGGPRVMRNQLRHLVDLASRPHITIEVVPFSAGVYPGLRGSFTILEFPAAEDDDVLHLESPGFMRVTRDLQEAITSYRERFEELRKISLRPEGTAVLLNQLANEMDAAL
ncbi:helix-turn-helix domain-containing protein [Actinomadura opuntiae]|uniref:helix-turn-helix domain-containing protein n=1 Tax=Actinomadura sp. OS1-43 TaxID=604315 RepID=UPI00255AEDB2|nr:helix-turn-helix transcriptional regulator [Actinomadura sp. OS1-43]MDL4813562.1 helix-turn-helix transcriptional regulator [Actinomadura sp. OS1-43]